MKTIFVIVGIMLVFVGGYYVGIREDSEAIRLGDLARILLNFLALGIGIGIAAVIGYAAYLWPFKNKLSIREQKLENAKSALQQERDKFLAERLERIRAIVKTQEQMIQENVHQACKDAKISMSRQIEEKVENRYRMEMERLQGIKHRPTQEEKIVIKKKTITGKSQIYRASNGKIYARLCEGEATGKS